MEDEAPGGSRGRALRVGALIAGIVGVLGLANLTLVSAWGSLWAQEVEASRAAAVGVGLAAVLVGVVLPSVGIWLGIRALRRRGWRVNALVGVGLLGLWNALMMGAVIAWSPVDAPTLVAERGTYVIDGIVGQGPFGPAALPTVERRVQEARGVQVLDEAVELLASDSAAGEAIVALLHLDSTRTLREDEALNRGLDRLLGRWGIDLDEVRGEVRQAQLPADGRALLRDVVALQPGQRWSWPAILPAQPELQVRSREVMAWVEPAGWLALYEEGAWRIYTGDVQDHVARVRPEAPDAPRVLGSALEPEIEVEVREALRAAAQGRYGWMTGTHAFQAGWPEALSGRTAVYQAERVRAWCAEGGDAVPDQARLFQRFGLGEPSVALTNAQVDLLVPQGRTWFTEVLTLCQPRVLARQAAEALRGVEIPERLRARWAEQDADRLLKIAEITAGPEPGLVTILLPGEGAAGEDRVRTAIFEEGAWRIEWGD